MEEAGVRLHRAFGYNEIPNFDPFLMLDDSRADRPKDYLAGFPWVEDPFGIFSVGYSLTVIPAFRKTGVLFGFPCWGSIRTVIDPSNTAK
jgi:hypothetical protein